MIVDPDVRAVDKPVYRFGDAPAESGWLDAGGLARARRGVRYLGFDAVGALAVAGGGRPVCAIGVVGPHLWSVGPTRAVPHDLDARDEDGVAIRARPSPFCWGCAVAGLVRVGKEWVVVAVEADDSGAIYLLPEPPPADLLGFLREALEALLGVDASTAVAIPPGAIFGLRPDPVLGDDDGDHDPGDEEDSGADP